MKKRAVSKRATTAERAGRKEPVHERKITNASVRCNRVLDNASGNTYVRNATLQKKDWKEKRPDTLAAHKSERDRASFLRTKLENKVTKNIWTAENIRYISFYFV